MKWESLGRCTSYMIGRAEIKVALPAERPFCLYCEHLNYHTGFDRFQCARTGEWIFRARTERGEMCPFTDWEEVKYE